MFNFLLWLFLGLSAAHAQNTTCATRPAGDSSNACASTAFVNGSSGNILPVSAGGTGRSSFTSNLPLIGNGTGPIAQGTRSGNTTGFLTFSGTLTNGDCLSVNSGNAIDAGGPCGTGSGTVSAGLTGQLAYYAADGTTVTGTFAPNFPATGQWYVDNGANIQRWNDQALFGGATAWGGHPGYTAPLDWLSSFQQQAGVVGGGSVQFATLSALTTPSSAGANNESGLLGGAQSLYSTFAGASSIAVNAFALNDNEQWVGTGNVSGTTFNVVTTTSGTVAIGQFLQISGSLAIKITGGSGSTWTLASSGGSVATTNLFTGYQTSVWAYYSECHRLFATAGQCNAGEFEVRNLADEVAADPFTVQTSPTNEHITTGISSGCGAGLSITGEQPCTAALLIFKNPQQWDTGILFTSGSIHGVAGGAINAIAMPADYEINWYTAANTISATVAGDSSGNLILNTVGNIVVDSVPSQNCSGASVTITQVTKGIITGCH